MVVFSPVAQQSSSGIEDRLQAIQEILRRSDQQTVIAIDQQTCDVTEAATAALAASKGRDLMQPFRRRSWRSHVDCSSHVDFHRQIGLKHDAKVTSSSHQANQGTADTELPSVKMGTPSAGRA